MYLIPIPVPIYRDRDESYIATDWKRALVLLRDSLRGRYGPLVVAAPSLPAEESDQTLERATLTEDGISLVPLFDQRVRLRTYWLGAHQHAMRTLRELTARARVLHGTVEDPLRPFTYASFMQATRLGIPSVLVQDQDAVVTFRDLASNVGTLSPLNASVHAMLHQAQCWRAARVAGLCLFKGRGTVARYRGVASHILQIEDTSYLSTETVPRDVVRARLRSLMTTDRPIRLVYCGRLVRIKGLDRSLRIVRDARARGAHVSLEIVGTGPERAALEALTGQLGLGEAVRFLGPMRFGAELIRRIGECDALLFNPRVSETPRMIFDGYAAGLPLIADGIDYVLERRDAEGAALVLPRNDAAAAADALVALDRHRAQLELLTQRAVDAGVYHAADNWYARRAAATHEMVARHEQRLRAA